MFGFREFSADGHDKFNQNNEERLAFVQAIFKKLDLPPNVVFLGHSRGSENALKMGSTNADLTQGIILINPLGVKRHRSARPFFKVGLATFVWNLGFLKWFMGPLLYNIYHCMGLRVPDGSVAGRSIECMFRANLKDQLPFIEKINASSTRTLILYGGKDALIEERVSRHFAESFAENVEQVCTEKTSEEALMKRIERTFDDRRNVSVFCTSDGHFIQKHRAELIAKTVKFMLDC
ncbi:hypothetical protein L596_012530 [Steinernema carpocapsae]|uniref:Serine aminopeptidase S33 domain-containing protein n=1 Tax=Steinernema carpocapsae TaxID=34508 RepID=A0A4U5NXG5_STECR|nr:hypothetical protein L596_012530 [Steinernema carpocapsae]